jgi:hypothetical protein
MSGTHEYYGQVLPSENQPIFDPMSTALVLNSMSSAEIFSEQTQPRFTPSFHPSNTRADVSFDFSLNSDFLAGSFGEPAAQVAAGIGGNTFSVTSINHFPWDDPLFQPKTSINGGTFIGGNVNHNQHHGEPGACQTWKWGCIVLTGVLKVCISCIVPQQVMQPTTRKIDFRSHNVIPRHEKRCLMFSGIGRVESNLQQP